MVLIYIYLNITVIYKYIAVMICHRNVWGMLAYYAIITMVSMLMFYLAGDNLHKF